VTSEWFRRFTLVNGSGLDQLEETRLRFELCSVSALHVETSRHRSKGCRKRAARGVFEGLSGLEGGLFAHDAGAVDFFGVARAVDDRPMAIEELDGRVALIGNADRVEKEPATGRWIAVLRRIVRANSNADAGRFSLGECFERIVFGHGRDLSRRIFCQRRQVCQ